MAVTAMVGPIWPVPMIATREMDSSIMLSSRMPAETRPAEEIGV